MKILLLSVGLPEKNVNLLIDHRKLWMQVSLTFLLVSIMSFHLLMANDGFSQGLEDETVILEAMGKELSEVLTDIEGQTTYRFAYNSEIIDGYKIHLERAQRSLARTLDLILQDKPLKYELINEKFIVITSAPVRKAAKTVVPVLLSKSPLRLLTKPELNLTGVVSDRAGEPLIGVNILVKGTNQGTATDLNGQFELQNIDENAVLVISYIGYQTQEVSVNGQTSLTITLLEDSQTLEEVVVVGYGTQKKANLTGAVATVSREQLENKPIPNLGEVLRGVSPNLNINLGAYGSEPGASLTFNIRGVGSVSGNSAPLILVDGVEMDINNIDPGTIEDISILKDASSSAIYGSRAPFGVILITTKKGNKNEQVQIQYNNNMIFGRSIGIPHFENSLIFATVYNQAAVNAGTPPQYPEEQMERIRGFINGTYKTEYDPANPTTSVFTGRRIGNANYDWPHILFKDYKFDQRHNVSISGGSQRSQYYVSLGYFDQDGFYGFGYDDYKRYDLMANLNTEATDWLSFNFSAKYANTFTDYPIGITTVERRYIGNSLYSFGPIQPHYNPDGTEANPLVRYLESSGRDKTYENDLLVTLGTELELAEGWKTNISYNYNITESNRDIVSLPVWVVMGNGTLGNIGKPASAFESVLAHSPYKLFNVVSSYEKQLTNHFVKLLVGYEQEDQSYKALNGRKENLITESVPSISTALGSSTLTDRRYDWATQGFFGRLNYNFQEKYLLEISTRYNGSSRFDPDSRWGFFPSASVGYQISREHFWTPLEPVISHLKLRASYGSLGNQNVSNYLYIPTINVNAETPWIIGNSRPPYALTPGILSENLTWETITMANFGFDAGLIDNKLMVTFDMYSRKTTDMFGPQETLPYTLGTGTPTANNASLSTKGFEVILRWHESVNQDFSYDVQLSMGDYRSRILEYRNENGFIDNWYNGKDIGEIWGFKTDGLIQTEGESMADQTEIYPNWGPGDMKYQDLNGDGKITEGNRTLGDHGDLTVIGNSTPRFNVGIAGGFQWKNFDFHMNWSGNLKQDYLPAFGVNAFWGLTNSWANSAVFKDAPVLDYWRPADETNILGPNTDAYFPKPYFSNETLKNRKPQSKYVLNAAYLRLRNIQLGYTLPDHLYQKLPVKNARVFLSGGNFITIKSLPKTVDPEQTIVGEVSYNTNGYLYPMAATLTAGLNITF